MARLAEAAPGRGGLAAGQRDPFLIFRARRAMVLVAPRETATCPVQPWSIWDRAGRSPVLVGEDGGVENRIVTIGGALDHGALDRASNLRHCAAFGRAVRWPGKRRRPCAPRINAGKSQKLR